MIIYLIKGIGCSLALWAFHYFFLEKERMHVFNRFYLLAAPLLSFLIPFIPMREVTLPTLPANPQLSGELSVLPLEKSVENSTLLPTQDLSGWFTGIYLLVATLLFLRFLIGFFRIWHRIKTSEKHSIPGAMIIAIPVEHTICTFLHYVLYSEKEYPDRQIPEPILRHEIAHVRQHHTFDILFIELLSALYWFNPVLVLYRKSIRLNHEFLADQSVTSVIRKVSDYQNMLLDQMAAGLTPPLASTFNYSQTKKRLLMMNQKTNKNRILWKVAFLSSMTTGLFYAASDEALGQELAPLGTVASLYDHSIPPPPPLDPTELPVAPPPPPPYEAGKPGAGATAKELAEYKATFEKHKIQKKNARGKVYSSFHFSDKGKERLLLIAQKMSQKQSAAQPYLIYQMPMPQKETPSPELFESFKRADVYGVWLDGKKVDNKVLDAYSNKDIAQYVISRLDGKAKIGRNYTHQLDLETTRHFDVNFSKRMDNRVIASERVRVKPKN